MHKLINGSIVALVTPMAENGDIDWASCERILLWHLESGSDGILLLGTTGESPTISLQEREQLIKYAHKIIAGRVPLIVGTGSHCTRTTCERSIQAGNLGVDACLVVTPYYNRPSQSGLIAHYSAVSQATDVPILVYNVPHRTGVDIAYDTVLALSAIDNIVGIKDASASSIERLPIYQDSIERPWLFYSGCDESAHEYVTLGGNGVISVAANVVPGYLYQMIHLAIKGESVLSSEYNQQLLSLYQFLSDAGNPVAVKALLHHLGYIGAGIRLPLYRLDSCHIESMHKIGEQIKQLVVSEV